MARKWTRDEEILAFALYCKTPFGKIHLRNPEIRELAEVLQRTPSSVAMKMCNFAPFDPELKKRGVTGLRNSSSLDYQIWNEFSCNMEWLQKENERVKASYRIKDAEEEQDSVQQFPQGRSVEKNVSVRVNQSFFRKAVLLSYNYRCCVTGIPLPTLLNASHIKPWAVSDPTTERTNPRNGLCLNALHDRAFDKGLITVDEDFRIVVSKQIKDMYAVEAVEDYFGRYEGKKILLPNRFMPDQEFLRYHNEYIFVE